MNRIYLPNYRGPSFIFSLSLRSCLDWMDRRRSLGLSIHPFCNKVKRDPLETECTDDRSSVALCNLVQHPNELPPHFQVRTLSKTCNYINAVAEKIATTRQMINVRFDATYAAQPPDAWERCPFHMSTITPHSVPRRSSSDCEKMT